MSERYNYRHFPQDLEADTFAAFPDHLHPGDRAPDGAVIDATTGESIPLSSIWRTGPVVLEFGSTS